MALSYRRLTGFDTFRAKLRHYEAIAQHLITKLTKTETEVQIQYIRYGALLCDELSENQQ